MCSRVIQHFVITFACLVNCINSDLREDWLRSSFYYGILNEARSNESDVSVCTKEIGLLLDNLENEELWALKAYDASGATETNFVYGQTFWLGSEDACDNLNHPMRLALDMESFIELKTTTSPFQMEYAIIYANYTTNKQFAQPTFIYVPIHIGLCMPRSCQKPHIFELSENYFNKNYLRFQNLYNITLKVVDVKKTSFNNFILRSDVQILVCGLIFFTTIVLAMNFVPMESMPEDGTIKRVVACFNIKNNYKNLMSTHKTPGSIVPMDTIKTFTCLLIMLGHMAYYTVYASSNPTLFYFAQFDLRLLVLFLIVLYVDAFFVMSAFLLCYNFLKNEQQKTEIKESGFVKNFILYLKLVLRRYIRITPAFMLTIVVSHLVAVYIKYTSPFNVPTNLDLYCKPDSWWKSLIYIHGYYPWEDMCSSWTWYLAADMQYFLICLLGLFIYVKNQKAGKLFFTCLFVTALTYSFLLNWIHDLRFTMENFLKNLSVLYINPLTRANPYFPGILGGYFLYKIKDNPIKFSKCTIITWALISITSVVATYVYFSFVHMFPLFLAYIMNSIGRCYLGFLLVATIIFTHLGHGSAFGRFLCHRYFIHLSKLTYLLYLLYPTLAVFYVAKVGVPFYLSVSSIYVTGIGVCVICYFLSIIATIFFEIPYCRLSSEFILNKNNKIKSVCVPQGT